MKKRLISLILVLCMLFPMCCYAEEVPAAEEQEEPAPVVTEQIEEPAEEPIEEESAEELAPMLSEEGEDPDGGDDPAYECPHEWSEETGLWWYDFLEDQAVDNEDGTHTVPGYRITEWHCTSCGENYEIRAEEPDSITDTHYYYLDVCTICGTKNPCDHSTGEQQILRKDREIAEGSVADNEDGTHSVKYRNYTQYLCSNCSCEYVVYDETWTGPVNEDHSWNINGYCSFCGANNSCSHPNLVESELKKPGRYYQYDENEHTVCGGVYTLYSCTDCGMAYELYQEEFMEDEPHDFSNGNCVCGACGHMNAQSEGDSWETMEDVEANLDGATHTGTLVTYTRYYCPDCNKYFVRVTGRQEGVTRNHEFGDERCMICGAENICEHDGGQYTETNCRVDYDTIESYDEKTHCFPSTLYINTYCELCGACIDMECMEENPYTRPHNFYDGVCGACGYTSECLHTNTHETFSFYSDHDLGSSEPIDGTALHTVPGYVVVYAECLDCGESTVAGVIESESTEPHNYNADGYCYACGQLNVCEHKNVAEEEWTNYGSATDNGDDGHQVNAWAGIYRCCKDCGAYIGMEQTSDVEETVLPHRYQNGVCTECGRLNPCTHEDAKTTTAREYITLSYTQTQHTIYAQDQTQTICDCGELISATAVGDAEKITEDHTMVRDGENMVCKYCGYTTKAEPCKTHKYVKVNAVAATCTEPGHKEYYECSVCGTPKTEPVEIPAKGHAEKRIPAVEKTCTEPGWSEYIVCSVCGIPLTTPVIDNPVGHVHVDDPAVESNCITMGLTAGVHCSVCNEILEPQEELGYGDHRYDDFECVYCGRIADIEVIELSSESIDLGVKDSYQIAPFVRPVKAAGHLVYSSSNPSIAKVNGNGLVTALKPGYASISVMGDGEQAALDVYVYAGISKLVPNCKTMQMEIGENSALSVDVTGYSANDLTWSSSAPSIVEVSEVQGDRAMLVGKQVGTATIKVQASNGKSATCKVTVVDPTKLAGVKLWAENTNPFIGDQLTFKASAIPTFTEEDGVQISFKSSNPKVLSIHEATGTAQANAAGTVTVTATATKDKVKKSTSIKITVTDPAKLTGLAVNGIAVKQTMYLGDAYTVDLIAYPGTEQLAESCTFSVKVANPALLSAVQDGSRVTLNAAAPGTTKVTFTAIAGKVKKIFNATVTILDPAAPVSVTIQGDDMPEMEPGVPASVRYTAQIDAEDCNASAYTVTWKSSNPKIATIDSEGMLTILKPGTVNLTVIVKYGSVTKTAQKKITILDQNVLYAVTADKSSLDGQVGSRIQINGLIHPYGLDRSSVSLTFTSSSAKLATVDEHGFVKLLAPGTATITVTAKQGKVTKTTKVVIRIVAASN